MHQIIYPGYGLEVFKGKEITKKLVLELYDAPDKFVKHGNYSIEMKYEMLGLRFYYLQKDDPTLKKKKSRKKIYFGKELSYPDEIPIITLGFRPPFKGMTEEGIALNESTMEDVFKILGKENWLTADEDKFWWVEHSGIAFYVDRDPGDNPSNFNEKKYLKRKITRITVPVKDREEDAFRNEDGKIIRSLDEFCIDGREHTPIFDEERAEEICAKCGLVISEKMISIDLSGQRAFSTEERNKREQHGAPINALVPDLQMATMIDRRAPMPEHLKKAIKWDSRYSWKQRNMIQATSEIKRIGELLNLPQHVKEFAIKLYRKAFQRGLLKGRSIKAMVAASLYYACGYEKIPRTLNEIVAVSDSDFHDVTKSYQVLIKELKLQSPMVDPQLLVSKHVANLNLSHDIEVTAQKIIERYTEVYSLSGKDPKGVVAAALYIAAQHHKQKISQSKISKSIGITEVTLRNRLREMQRFTRRLLSK